MSYSTAHMQVASTMSQSAGTVSVARVALGEESRWVSVESVAMYGGDLRLRNAPRETTRSLGVREAVVASLECSLKDNADVWTELSKY